MKNQNPLVLRTTFPLTGHFNSNFGFTLIELLVAITIGSILIGLASVSLNGFNEQQKVRAVKQEVLSNLRLARNYAITGQLPNTANKVVVTINNEGLMVIGFQNASNNSVGTTKFSKDITPKGVAVDFDKEVKFSVTDGRSILGNILITIAGGDSTEEIINIEGSGLIYE